MDRRQGIPPLPATVIVAPVQRTDFGGERDLAAHALDDQLNDGQAQAGARVAVRRVASHLITQRAQGSPSSARRWLHKQQAIARIQQPRSLALRHTEEGMYRRILPC